MPSIFCLTWIVILRLLPRSKTTALAQFSKWQEMTYVLLVWQIPLAIVLWELWLLQTIIQSELCADILFCPYSSDCYNPKMIAISHKNCLILYPIWTICHPAEGCPGSERNIFLFCKCLTKTEVWFSLDESWVEFKVTRNNNKMCISTGTHNTLRSSFTKDVQHLMFTTVFTHHLSRLSFLSVSFTKQIVIIICHCKHTNWVQQVWAICNLFVSDCRYSCCKF